jgi:hypothetical protein
MQPDKLIASIERVGSWAHPRGPPSLGFVDGEAPSLFFTK